MIEMSENMDTVLKTKVWITEQETVLEFGPKMKKNKSINSLNLLMSIQILFLLLQEMMDQQVNSQNLCQLVNYLLKFLMFSEDQTGDSMNS
jgi:hypothetical protein